MLDYDSFPSQRQDLIRAILLDQGKVVCVELAQEMGVSEHTIRRDLHELSKEGICKKVYGGAILQLPDAGALAIRKEHNLSSKDLIGQKCASLIKNGSCIFIDAGSTNLAIAHNLADELALTVVTNTPDIAAELLKYSNVEVIMLGGRIEKESGSTVGSIATKQIGNIIFDQAFIGGCAMDFELGVTGFNYDDCEFKKTVISRSNQVIIGITAEKTPGAAKFTIASCEDIDVLVVEEKIGKDYCYPQKPNNMTILTV